MSDTERVSIKIDLDTLENTVSELERLMVVLAERLGATPVTHQAPYQDK